jgi:hypothetical protein
MRRHFSSWGRELARALAEFEQADQSATRIQSPTFRAMVGSTYALVLAHLGQRDHRARVGELLQESLAIARRCELHAIGQQSLELARHHDFNLASITA